MNAINENELFENLRGFLKAKGINLTKGSYSHTVQRSCSLLTDAINLGQQGFDRAGTEINKRMDQLRQCIHEKTAPKAGPAAAPPNPPASAAAAEPPRAAKPGKKGRRRKAEPRKPAPRKPSR